MQKRLGGGKYATVYECYDPDRDERVAVKVLSVASPDPHIAREMYSREVGALDGFQHESVVQMFRFEAEEDQQRLNIVLELVNGGITLDQLIAGEASLPVASNLRWKIEQLLGILEALDRAHGRGIIHRDVKLSNLLVDREQQRLKLADFGIARILENYGRTSSGETLREFYTPPFAAPEQSNGRDTSFPADLHAFGVVAVSLLAWRVPPLNFEASHIAAYLAPLSQEESPAVSSKLPDVLRRLMAVDPDARPKVPEIELVLRAALDATVERLPLRVFIFPTTKQKAAGLGFAGPALLNDLNEGLRVSYADAQGDKSWSIVCIGQRTQGRLIVNPDEPGKLKMVDFIVPHPTEIARRREHSTAAPFLLVEGEASGQLLIDFVWEDHLKQLAEDAKRDEREELLGLARFILQRQRERLEMIRVRYRVDRGDEAEPVARAAPKAAPVPAEPWKQKLAALTTTPARPPDDPPRPTPDMTRTRGEVMDLVVLAVQHGRQSEVDEAEMVDDAIPEEWEDGLNPDSTFGYKDRDFATAHGYDRVRKVLSLKIRRDIAIPVQGEITCEDVATRTALDRQDSAIDRFIDDLATNPRLGRLMLHPEENSLGDQPPIDLLQVLEPAETIADLVSRALAAQDFFLVQGPPGTGKTTLITEVMSHIMRRDPRARVLLTSQSNEAVNNAMDALRDMNASLGERWRLVRDRRESSATKGQPVGFDYAFREWATQTQARSEAAEAEAIAAMPPGRARAVADALARWREKLPFIPDAKDDYAASVQVWGMTLLRIPSVKKRLREVRFDYVIVDEAARATPAELMVALVTGKRFILVGDHRQLPPFMDNETVDDLRAADMDVDRARRAFFEELFHKVPDSNRATLRRQYRMHRSIGKLVGDRWYADIGLETGVPDHERELPLKRFGGDNRVFWLDVAEGREQQLSKSTSWWNPDEVLAIDSMLEDIERELLAQSVTYTVGVIAAYGDQKLKLRERIREGSKRWQALRIKVDTVDAFQGKQADIMFYSNVRANTTKLNFVGDPHRLNVAFSRAKRLLVIVGHLDTAKLSPQLGKVIEMVPPANIIKPRGAR